MIVSERPAPAAITVLPALTSLRFLAALAIVIHHCNGVFWPAADLGPLDAGVSFFFVLSGFILTYVYVDSLRSQFAWRHFYRARIARIWPLHLFCLFATVIFVKVPEPFDPAVLLANGLMLHAWIPLDRYFFSYNYPAWSISTELFFYLMLPLLIRAAAWQRYVVLALALATVLALAQIGAAAHLPVWNTSGNHLSSTGLLYTNPLARFSEFLVGIICEMRWVKKGADAPAEKWLGTLIECAAVGVFALAFGFYLHDGATLTASHWMPDTPLRALLGEWLSHVGLTPFAAVLIMVFAHHRGWLSHVLSQRWLVFLGEISFALYLVHQIALRWLQQQGGHFTLLDFGLFLICITVLATVLHLGIEKPVRRWLVQPLRFASAQSIVDK